MVVYKESYGTDAAAHPDIIPATPAGDQRIRALEVHRWLKFAASVGRTLEEYAEAGVLAPWRLRAERDVARALAESNFRKAAK